MAMGGVPVDDEQRRLAALGRYGVLDTELEDGFEDLVRIASHVVGARAVTISFVGADRVWFGARLGVEVAEAPRAHSFCDRVVAHGGQMVVPDARADERFSSSSADCFASEVGLWVGTPLRSSDDFIIGSLCAFDDRAREPSDQELELLAAIARQIESQLELRREALAKADEATSAMRATEAIEEGAARMRAVLDTALDGIITIDERGMIESFNPSAARTFGYSPEEVVGSNVRCLMPSPFRDEHDSYLEAYRRTGKATVIGSGREVVGLRKDGTTFPLDLAVSEVCFRDQRVFVGIVRDISDRKLAEQAKDEFVSTVSHELRTPLTSIAGALRLIEGGAVGDVPEDAMELIRIASNNSQRLIRLINNILDLEKIALNRPQPRRDDVALAEVVERTVAGIEVLASEAGVGIDVEISDLPRVSGDADQMVQVLTNLVSNAIKFSPTGSAVSVRCVDLGERVRLEVIDRGPGIAADDVERIFDRFHQVDSSDSRGQGGTGLGLAISRAIVHRHDGEIGVITEPGAGARFWCELPAHAR